MGKPAVWAAVFLAAAVVFLAGKVFAPGGNAPGAGEPGAPGASGGETESTAETETEAPEPLPVSEEEEVVLSAIYKAMEEKDLTAAARAINENEELLKALVQDTLGGEKYCYYEEKGPESAGGDGGAGNTSGYSDGGSQAGSAGDGDAGSGGTEIHRMKKLGDSRRQRGLVVTRYNTVFFGSFLSGQPEGTCTAVQAMVLDGARYTYAVGSWSGGKMNGQGKTGYYCYEDAPEGGFVSTEKDGQYTNNLLDGPFTYRTENQQGECLHWDMEADAGVTVLTDGWRYYDHQKSYMLPSAEDPSRAYVLKEEQTGAVLWNNLILWD